MKKQKKELWHKPRHTFYERLLHPFATIYLRMTQGYRFKHVKLPKGPVLILCNHVCELDPILLGLLLKKPFYFVAMADITSDKKVGPIVQHCFHCIPKSKGLSDLNCVKMMFKVKNEGNKLIVFPEGNRTYDGKKCHIDSSIAKLIKQFACPVAFFNIHGGYGSDPRWGYKTRKGKTYSELRALMMPEEYANLTNDEIMEKINEYLTVDDYALEGPFKGKNKANYLERFLYKCPDCGEVGHLHSEGDDFYCDKCGYRVKYNEHMRFELINGKAKVETVYDWSRLDKQWLISLKLEDKDQVIFKDEHFNLFEVFNDKPREYIYENCTVTGYANRIVFEKDGEKKEFLYDDIISGAAVGKFKANFYVGKSGYQLQGEKWDNAFKYIMLYYHYTHVKKGDVSIEEFLGI